jgi:hypothetical protein
MSDFTYPLDPVNAFEIAVLYRSDVDAMRRYAAEEPALFAKLREQKQLLVCDASKRRTTPDAIKTLIELGADVNERDSNGYTGLCWAVTYGRYDVAKALLESGADPNLDCPLFRVVDEDVKDSIAMAKLLLDHGADINHPFEVEDLSPRTVLTAAMDSKRTDLIEFLKSRGAKLPGDAAAKKPTQAPKASAEHGSYSADILAHLRKHFGKPEKKVVREVAPTSDQPVLVGCVPPSEKNTDSAVLFTIGLSQVEMPAPRGSEQFRRAELMLRIPTDWPTPDLLIKDAKRAWPILWMRKIAAYVANSGEWLGGPLTTFAEDDPPSPLAPGVKFTSWLLVAFPTKDTVVRCKDGATIQFYQLFPLYSEEYRYARKRGADRLMGLLVDRRSKCTSYSTGPTWRSARVRPSKRQPRCPETTAPIPGKVAAPSSTARR